LPSLCCGSAAPGRRHDALEAADDARVEVDRFGGLLDLPDDSRAHVRQPPPVLESRGRLLVHRAGVCAPRGLRDVQTLVRPCCPGGSFSQVPFARGDLVSDALLALKSISFRNTHG